MNLRFLICHDLSADKLIGLLSEQCKPVQAEGALAKLGSRIKVREGQPSDFRLDATGSKWAKLSILMPGKDFCNSASDFRVPSCTTKGKAIWNERERLTVATAQRANYRAHACFYFYLPAYA